MSFTAEGPTLTKSTTGTNAPPELPYHQRKRVIRYITEDGNLGEEAYPINYHEVYNLKGRLLTLVDATFTDPQQRKAHKDMVWDTLRRWIEDVERDAKSEVRAKSDIDHDQAP